MAVKAWCFVVGLDWQGDGKCTCNVRYVGLEGEASGAKDIPDVEGNILEASFQTAIKDGIKEQLIDAHGYSFGLFDTVRFLGGGLI